MKVLVLLAVFLAMPNSNAQDMSKYTEHCSSWKHGKCISGPLTELAKFIKDKSKKNETTENTCNRVCEEACPKCNLCNFCAFCGIYDDAACLDVPYFEDRETCNVLKTDSCCKLCEVQCHAPEGVCGRDGYCKKQNNSSTIDLLTHCVEQTTDQQCLPCGGSNKTKP